MAGRGAPRELIEGNPVLIVIDIQGGAPTVSETTATPSTATMPFMEGYQERMDPAPGGPRTR